MYFVDREFVINHNKSFQSSMEGNADGSTNMDVGDSRKRPLDTESDDLTTKRSNYGHGECTVYMVPSEVPAEKFGFQSLIP